MTPESATPDAIRAGDVEGRSRIYDADGKLVQGSGETILGIGTGWDMNARSPWRRVLPKVIFQGFDRGASSRLYITTDRVVLIRDIDPWREVAGEMTPLGMPAALTKREALKKLAAEGVRQFCEVRPDSLKVVRVRKTEKGRPWIGLDLITRKGRQYSIAYWKTNGEDSRTLSLIESTFRR